MQLARVTCIARTENNKNGGDGDGPPAKAKKVKRRGDRADQGYSTRGWNSTTTTRTTTMPSLILLLLLCLGLHVGTCRAIVCYRCTIMPPQWVDDVDQLCSKFDHSSRFYQDCPSSTFCMKRSTPYRLTNGTMKTAVERDCAPQRYTIQDYNSEDRKWHQKESVDTEAYTEGCFKGENRGAPNGPPEYCYCSSNYCNTSVMAKALGIIEFLVAAVIFCLR